MHKEWWDILANGVKWLKAPDSTEKEVEFAFEPFGLVLIEVLLD